MSDTEEKKTQKAASASGQKSKGKIIFAAVVVIVLFVGASIAFMPLVEALTTEEGQQAILETVGGLGLFQYVIYFALQVLQIVIAVIPGGPIPLIGGMLFGEWMTLLLSAAGCFCGTVIVYYLVQAVGKPIVNLFVSDEQLRSYKFMQNPKRMEILVFLVFLCPGLPKDALTYIASLTPIRPMRLFLLTTIGRLPSLIATIWLGGSIWDKNYKMVIILAAVMIAAAAVGFFIKKKIEARPNQKEKGEKKNG
ncbi:MAG: TVP38/TMEM64 family protein [Ruminococcus sp.]|nr:TVP38/TMEM64 family protein [Ruminococcus sp.]